jgi:hypothetical protein
MNRVWVLGAGFSRSLGGPLMADILHNATLEQIRDRFPSLDLEPHGQLCVRLFRTQMSRGDKPGLWENPEEFLEKLDATLSSELLWKQVARVLARFAMETPTVVPKDPTEAQLRDFIKKLTLTTKRIVAAQVCGFLQESSPGNLDAHERWLPYLNWVHALTPGDTIITFNYDRVPDILAEYVSDMACGIHIATSRTSLDTARNKQAICFKLHGSVSWSLDPDADSEWNLKDHGGNHALDCDPDSLAIATPGNGKLSARRNFRGAWDAAEAALSNANQIIVVGYSFPPSDSQARQRLLNAIRNRENSQNLLRLGVVLGPESQDRERVTSLLRMVTDAPIDATPLRAEEFLSGWTPNWGLS